MSEYLIEKLAEISIRVFTIGRAIGDKDLEKLSAELNSLSADIAKKDWHTGTPTEYGLYLVQYIHGGYDIVLFDPSASGWDIYSDDSPKDIVAWQKIEPLRG